MRVTIRFLNPLSVIRLIGLVNPESRQAADDPAQQLAYGVVASYEDDFSLESFFAENPKIEKIFLPPALFLCRRNCPLGRPAFLRP